jgi:hypothetical protein
VDDSPSQGGHNCGCFRGYGGRPKPAIDNGSGNAETYSGNFARRFQLGFDFSFVEELIDELLKAVKSPVS